MSAIEDLSALLGCKLRAPLDTVRARLGLPDEASFSPGDEKGSRFGNYVWLRRAPPIAILTWFDEGKEWIWGVGILGTGEVDEALGFGVGAHRDAVASRIPAAREATGDSLTQALQDGLLTITFRGDVVSEIRLVAAMGESSD